MKTRQPSSETKKIELISFVIPAWNEAAVLPLTMQAVSAATRRIAEPCEIIVADDSSTDQTAEIARQCGARVITVSHRQIAATRNAGAREARGDLLFFIDADTLVTVEAVQAAVAAVRQGAVGGGCAFRFDGRVPLYARLLQTIAVGVYRLVGLASGCFLFCTREAFDAAGGFDTRLHAAEEAAMSLALRRHGRFVVLRHHVTTSGRKLRTHTAGEILLPLVRMALSRGSYLYNRREKEIWYAQRRPDPSSAR